MYDKVRDSMVSKLASLGNTGKIFSSQPLQYHPNLMQIDQKYNIFTMLNFNKIVPIRWLYFGTRALNIVKLLYFKTHGL